MRLVSSIAARPLVLVAVLFSFGLTLAWSLLTPIDGAPDEREHILRAGAVARGELVPASSGTANENGAHVDTPAAFDALTKPAECFKFKAAMPAACAQPAPAGPGLVNVLSAAGRYFPVYYMVVGLPSLAFPHALGIYLMRIVSALVAGALVATALVLAGGTGRPLLALGVLAAATPSALFLNGVLNPSSWEISAAVCAWTAGTLLAFGAQPDRRLLVILGVAASIMVMSHQDAPFWLLLTGGVLALAAGRSRVAALARVRGLWIAALATAAAATAATAWTLAFDVLQLPHAGAPPYSLEQQVLLPLVNLSWRIQQMVALEGWLDTPAPVYTYIAWAAVAGGLVVLALITEGLRTRIALAALLVLCVVVPDVIEARGMPTYGLVWQGRYTLPLAAGLPILAAAIVDASPLVSVALKARFAALGGALLALAQFVAVWWGMIRFQAGADTTLNPLVGLWHPPVPHLVILGLAGVGALACALATWPRLYNRGA